MYINSNHPLQKVTHKCLIMIGLCLSLFFPSTYALAENEFSLNGFANIGLTYSEGNKYGFRTQLLNEGRTGVSLAPDSLLGLQANAKFGNKLSLVSQIVLQDRVDDTLNNYLELAFVRYQFNRNWNTQLGRFSTNSYLFTDFRYVSQASYWTRPPLEMYSTVGSLSNMDGAQLNYIYDADFGVVKLSTSIGQSKLNNDNDSGVFEVSYEELIVLNLELQSTDWRIQAAYLNARLNDFNFTGIEEVRSAPLIAPPIVLPIFDKISDAIIPDGDRVSYYSVGGKYYLGKLEIIAEYGDYNSEWALSQASRFGYLSFAYAADEYTPFITFAASRRNKEPEIIDINTAIEGLPSPLQALVAAGASEANEAAVGASIDQDSVSVGLRWDFTNNWAFKAQLDHFMINEKGSGLFSIADGSLTPREKTNYNVASISFATTF